MAINTDYYLSKLSNIIQDLEQVINIITGNDIPTGLINEIRRIHGNFIDTYEYMEKSFEHEVAETAEKAFQLKAKFQLLYLPILAKCPGIIKSEEKEISPANLTNNCISLPSLQVPTFSGNNSEWTDFITMFDSMIHSNANLTAVQKFQYLKSTLKGDALAIITGLTISDNNYAIAYNALRNRYANPRRLADHYFKQIQEFKSMQTASHSELNRFLTAHSNAVCALKAINLPDLADFLLFQMAVNNLDPKTRLNFETRLGTNTMPTYRSLNDFVTEQARAMELLNQPSTSTAASTSQQPRVLVSSLHEPDLINESYPNADPLNINSSGDLNQGINPQPPQFKPVQNIPQPRTFQARPTMQSPIRPQTVTRPTISPVSNRPGQSVFRHRLPPFHMAQANVSTTHAGKCIYCDSDHIIFHCNAFLDLTVPERKRAINQLQRCFNCLGSHFQSKCKSVKHCKHCGDPHHTLLHDPAPSRH